MDLSETFQAVAPAVVAFAETRILAPAGSPPLSPKIFATGFVVDPVGIVATNRHVIERVAELLPDPKTPKPNVAAILFNYGKTSEGKNYVRWIPAPLLYYTALESFEPPDRGPGSRFQTSGSPNLVSRISRH
jgi:hypothetical protein